MATTVENTLQKHVESPGFGDPNSGDKVPFVQLLGAVLGIFVSKVPGDSATGNEAAGHGACYF